MCSEGRLVSSPPASQRLFILPRYHRNITNIHPTLMYCFHSFDSRLLQGDVQTLQDSILGDFPLTVSESFPPFLSFISILFPLIPVFPPSFAFKSTSLHLFASSLPPSLDSLHLPPPPLSPESSLPSFAASLLYLFQSQSSHEPKVVPVRHFAGRPRALICE